MINPTSTWPQPVKQNQFSTKPAQDSDACISYSVVHSVESQIRFQLGDGASYSKRFLAKLSNTTPAGNSIQNVMAALKIYGLVKEEEWPEPEFFTWAEYYAPIPPEIVTKGQDFLRQWNISDLVQIAPLQAIQALTNAPLELFLPAGTPVHCEEVISPTECFNTYPPYVTPYPNSIYKYFQFIIKPKTMSNIEFVKKAGSQEFGFYIPALSEDALRDKALNFGFNILNPDNTINFESAKEVTGL